MKQILLMQEILTKINLSLQNQTEFLDQNYPNRKNLPEYYSQLAPRLIILR